MGPSAGGREQSCGWRMIGVGAWLGRPLDGASCGGRGLQGWAGPGGWARPQISGTETPPIIDKFLFVPGLGLT